MLGLLRVKNGERTELLKEAIPVTDDSIYLHIQINDRDTSFFWSMDGEFYKKMGDSYDTSEFSDEFCKHGEFIGTFVKIGCVDALLHEKYADFDFLEYRIKQSVGQHLKNKMQAYNLIISDQGYRYISFIELINVLRRIS